MAVTIVYCLDENGTGVPCFKVYDGENLVMHNKLEYPYTEVPNEGLDSIILDLRNLYADVVLAAGDATDDQIPAASYLVSDIGLKLYQTISIRNNRT